MSKKMLIIYILKILETQTDRNNVLSQSKIAGEFDFCDRKTVGRNIKVLIDAGYPIVKTSKGYFLDSKKFTTLEMDFIINAIQEKFEEDGINKSEIIEKLNNFLIKIYRK